MIISLSLMIVLVNRKKTELNVNSVEKINLKINSDDFEKQIIETVEWFRIIL